MPLSTAEQLQAIQAIIGQKLHPAPEWPEQAQWPLLGLMAYENNKPKYQINAAGALIGLNLANLGIDDQKWKRVLEAIDPSSLCALNLSDNQLSSLALSSDMKALKTINLNGNKKLSTFSFPSGGLQNLVRAELNECTFSELLVPSGMTALQALNVRFGKLKRLVMEEDCPVLEVLDLRDNQLSKLKLPANLPKLWYLNVNKNRLAQLELPAPLPELTTLDIRNNQLEQLESLHLLQHHNLDALYIYGNPWKLNQALLPESGDKNSIGAIKAFLEELEKDKRKNIQFINDRVKIILVGNGRVGKTTLYRRLRNLPLNQKEPYTHGLSIGVLEEKAFISGVKTDTLNGSVWDFGGQEIFYATHQFFLTEGALYILCWTAEEFVKQYRDQTEEERPFDGIWREIDYWLENIRLQGKDSPVLLVQTHCDKGNLPIPRTVEEKYTSDAIRFSAEEAYRSTVEDLRREMARKINEAIPDFGQPFASSYDKLIDAIAERKQQDPFISLDAFKQLASAPPIEINNIESALDFLRRSGVVVYFQENDRLKEVVYINPNWLTETVYKSFKNELLETEGRFDQTYLAKVLPEPAYSALDRERFIELLLQFDLVFREKLNNTFTGDYVAPQYLPDNLRPTAKTFFNKVFRTQELRFVYRFSRFLPDNVMVNFLSQFGPYSETVIWKEGIWFEDSTEPELNCTVMLDTKTRSLWVYTSQAPGYRQLSKSILDKFRTLSKQAAAEISLDGEGFVVLEKLQMALDKKVAEIEGANGQFIRIAGFAYLLGALHDGMTKTFMGEEPPAMEIAPEIRAELDLVKRDTGFYDTEAEPARIDASKLESFDRETKKHIEASITIETDIEDSYLIDLARRFGNKEISLTEYNNLSKLHLEKFISKIIFLAASPDDQNRLHIEEEFDKLSKQLKPGNQREKYRCVLPKLRLNMDDLIRAFNEKPGILHFSGHGTLDGIYILDELGKSVKVDEELLEYLIAPHKESLKLVILNACLSSKLAETISKLGPLVIGHSLPVSDPAAITFTDGFYIGLGDFTNDYHRAFHAGKSKVMLKYRNEALRIEAWKDGKKQNW